MSTINILVWGAKASGKTSIVNRLIDGLYSDQQQQINVYNAKDCKTDITASSLPLPQVLEEKRNWGGRYQGIVLCYDVTSYSSFEVAKKALLNLRKEYNDGCRNYAALPIILVGTKTDNTTQRVVDYNVAKQFADDNDLPFRETSANRGYNVTEAFELLINKIFEEYPGIKPKPTVKTPLVPNKNSKKTISERLQKYIDRMESCKTHKRGFARDFWFFKNSRAVNREANYELAKKLKAQIDSSRGALPKTFKSSVKVEKLRANLIAENKLFTRPFFKNRGINSGELKKIIQDAQKEYSKGM